jgi:dolichol-phosphate mannosyltransferase
MSPEVSIVIPAHNEEAILEKTVRSIIAIIDVPSYELLICNDHSTDQTPIIGKHLADEFSQVHILNNTNDKGFGNVVRFGFSQAKGKYVVLMMADLCDDPHTLNVMYKKIQQGYDVVVGSRYIKGGAKRNVQNHFKSFCSWGAGQIGWHFQRISTHDTTNAFKMIRRSALQTIPLTSNTFDISMELTVKLHKKGYKMTEVPTVWTDRSEDLSKFKIVRVAKNYVRWVVGNNGNQNSP